MNDPRRDGMIAIKQDQCRTRGDRSGSQSQSPSLWTRGTRTVIKIKRSRDE
jgi:hypothetical protein